MGTTRSTRCLAQTAQWLGAAVTNMAALPDDLHVEGAILGLGSARENRFLGSERPTPGAPYDYKIDLGFRARPAQGGLTIRKSILGSEREPAGARYD